LKGQLSASCARPGRLARLVERLGTTEWGRLFVPLWLVTMLPEVDCWGRDLRRRRVAAALLAF
jgi:hypothetical protein